MRPTARHMWQRPILTHPVGPPVWFQRCITPHTPWTLIPLRYCHLRLSLRDPLHLQYPVQLPGENIRHNSGTKPTAQASRDSWCSSINKDPETTYKTWFVNVHWLTRSKTVLQRTVVTANWAIVGCRRSTVWNCIGHLGPLHSFTGKGEGSVMYKS